MSASDTAIESSEHLLSLPASTDERGALLTVTSDCTAWLALRVSPGTSATWFTPVVAVLGLEGFSQGWWPWHSVLVMGAASYSISQQSGGKSHSSASAIILNGSAMTAFPYCKRILEMLSFHGT